MKFRFKFQKLLVIEKYREEELVKELQKIQKKLQDERHLEKLLKSLLATRQSEMEKAMHNRIDIEMFVLFESYFAKLNRDIKAQNVKVEEASKLVEQAREKLLVVFKRRKLLEKLRERHEQEFREQELRIENKQLDEIATSRYFYNSKNKEVN